METIKWEWGNGKRKQEPGLYSACITSPDNVLTKLPQPGALRLKGFGGLDGLGNVFAIVACPNLPQPSLVLQSTSWARLVSLKWVTQKLTSDLSFPFHLLTLIIKVKLLSKYSLIYDLQTGCCYCWWKAKSDGSPKNENSFIFYSLSLFTLVPNLWL